jgi:hypothetical protein
MRRVASASLLVPLLAVGAGCGLISSDVVEIRFNLPPRMYSFTSGAFSVPPGLTQDIPCGDGQLITDCCHPPAGIPGPDCSTTQLTCEANDSGANVCTVTATLSQSQMMNLGQEVSQLHSFTGLVTIKINRITYQVTANTLDITVPDVELFLAPSGVTDPSDPSAKKFGTLPAIPAGTTPSGDVVLEPSSTQVLASFTSNIQAPFMFIAATTVKASHAPNGGVDITINGQLAASP